MLGKEIEDECSEEHGYAQVMAVGVRGVEADIQQVIVPTVIYGGETCGLIKAESVASICSK